MSKTTVFILSLLLLGATASYADPLSSKMDALIKNNGTDFNTSNFGKTEKVPGAVTLGSDTSTPTCHKLSDAQTNMCNIKRGQYLQRCRAAFANVNPQICQDFKNSDCETACR